MPYLSALEVCSRRGAIQIHVYLYFYSTDNSSGILRRFSSDSTRSSDVVRCDVIVTCHIFYFCTECVIFSYISLCLHKV